MISAAGIKAELVDSPQFSACYILSTRLLYLLWKAVLRNRLSKPSFCPRRRTNLTLHFIEEPVD